MAAGTVVATSGSVAKKRYWVKVREGSAVAYHLDDATVVSELLQQVQTKEKLAVGVGKMKLYQSEELFKKGEALNPMKPIPKNEKDDEGTPIPFYVHYPDVQRAAKRQRTNVEVIAQLVRNLAKVRPVTLSAAALETQGTDWNRKVREHYESTACAVLSSLFPDDADRKPRWFRHDPFFKKSDTAFPAVAEHIIPKAQHVQGAMWGVDVHDASNGLLLLRHLERQYQAGKWTLIPTDNGTFRLFVVEALRNEEVEYIPQTGKAVHRVWVRRQGRDSVLLFGDLDGKEIRLRTKPSMRALYLKAEMAHGENPELPDPSHHMDAYQLDCPKMKEELWKRLRESTPDPALPVVQDVDDATSEL